jgi:uncharacterized protein
MDRFRTTFRSSLTAAMKRRDARAVSALRSVISAIDNAEAVDAAVAPDAGALANGGIIAGGLAGLGAGEVARRVLTDAEIHAIVQAEIDSRRHAADQMDGVGQAERAAALREDALVLEVALSGVGRGTDCCAAP